MATDISSPQRFFHMPRFQHQAPRQVFYKRPDFAQQQAMQQLTFDGKRMRKAVNRKTIDYNPSVIRHLENRLWQRDHRDFRAVQPDAGCYNELVPPVGMLNNPMNAVTTKFVRTSTNKVKCPVFVIRWTPEGRRLVTGASSGEFTLWNGLTFNFETILQAHDSPVRAMTWSHNDMWMLTADHGGYVKYWQSNMNNVKMFQAHKEAIREARFIPNLPFSVVKPSLCCSLTARRGRHVFTLLLWLIHDRCKCVLLQHCSDLLLMFMWLMSCFSLCVNKVIDRYLSLLWVEMSRRDQ
uniref:WD repeat domain 33 n=2 Tax=Labrus bergylta TaxID=56723 RepID=A0A3Q3N391_9LABR|nr:pre-mRNA 3' end processing protein WDR33-like [Labrus bergylta]